MTDTKTTQASDSREMIVQLPSFAVPNWMQPQSIADIEKFAAKLSAARWVPKGFLIKGTQDVDRAMVEVAIMHGMMVGIPWIMAPQVIAVINGTPSIWGDGMLAVVQASGLLEDMEETDGGEKDEYFARCRVKRHGRPTWIDQTFDVWKAQRAGLLNKEGAWQTAPKRMMQMRARAFALRDGFSDVLKGLHIAEEVMDSIIDVTPTAPVPDKKPDQESYRAPPVVDAQTPADEATAAPPRTRKRTAKADPAPTPPVETQQAPEETSVEASGPAFELADVNGEPQPYDDQNDFPKAFGELLAECKTPAAVDGFLKNNLSVLKWWHTINAESAASIWKAVGRGEAAPWGAAPAKAATPSTDPLELPGFLRREPTPAVAPSPDDKSRF